MKIAGICSALAVVLGTALALPCSAQIGRNPTPVPGSPPIGHSPKDDEHSIGRTKKEKKKSGPKDEQPTISFEGTTLSNDAKQMVVHTADGRWMTMSVDSGTKWLKDNAPIQSASIVPGTTVKAEAAIDEEQNLTALTIELTKEASPRQKADAAAKPAAEEQPDDVQLTQAKKPLDVPDAPDRPKLTRAHSIESGLKSVSNSPKEDDAPKPKNRDDEQQDFSIGLNTPARNASKGGPGSDILQRSMNWSETFDQGLPNYLCREVITRYVQETRGGDWIPQDVVSMNLVYQDGHEAYRDIMVGNKKVSDLSKSGGTWSTGEFESMLRSLYQPTRETDFKYGHTSAIHDIQAAEFDYAVELPNSDWSIIVGGQLLRPKYSGTIWIEKNTGVVRRLEQEAKNIPKDFPIDEVQTATDYEEVSLGAAKKFLLPVHAENIACQRASTVCTKNVIDFRDYHKFSGESTIEFK